MESNVALWSWVFVVAEVSARMKQVTTTGHRFQSEYAIRPVSVCKLPI